MRAQDLLPDDTNQLEMKGVNVRKGTIGAFLANARMLGDQNVSAAARAAAERDIIEALPALRAIGLFDVLQIRDPKLKDFVDRH
jgi:hypothetical protein